MNAPLVTPMDDLADAGTTEPTMVVLFNDRQGPGLVTEIVRTKHSFIETETWETEDELGRPAFLLVVWCETAEADALLELVGSRLPDYIQARRFPPSRLAHVRETGTQMT